MREFDPNETFGEFLERRPDWRSLDSNPLIAWSKELTQDEKVVEVTLDNSRNHTDTRIWV
jgi:hypothetical protein